MKKICCFLLAFALLMPCLSVNAAETMLSPSEIPLAVTEAEGLRRLGLMKGSGNGLDLERNVTRSEAVVLIGRITNPVWEVALDYDVPEGESFEMFEDVPDSHWAYQPLFYAKLAGAVNGTDGRHFEPERNVTGREFAKMLLSVMGYEGVTLENVYDKGKETGLLSNNFTKSVVWNDEVLLRSDVARICFGALTCKRADGAALYQVLIDQYVLKEEDLEGVLWSSEQSAEPQSFTDHVNALMPADRNYLFSPLSIRMALGLLANGAQGDTKNELLGAMQVTDLEAYNQDVRDLIETYSKADILNLNIANSLWINTDRSQGIRFSDTYQSMISSYYQGKVGEVDNASAVPSINQWVSDATNEKISTIINDNDFWAQLINAVYFKGYWASEFNEQATQKDQFTSRNGEQTQIDFMHRVGWMRYFSNDGLQIIELPYKNRLDKIAADGTYEGSETYSDLNLSMYILMSQDPSQRISDVEQLLKNEPLTSTYLSFGMPKFEINFEIKLNDLFKQLGIQKAFVFEAAEFAPMFSEGSMAVTDALHKTYINVNEKGTEAAAITSIAMAGSSLPPEPIEVNVDRPFTYVIRDNTNGEILFLGEYAYAQ